jgi:hypothetical protein
MITSIMTYKFLSLCETKRQFYELRINKYTKFAAKITPKKSKAFFTFKICRAKQKRK